MTEDPSRDHEGLDLASITFESPSPDLAVLTVTPGRELKNFNIDFARVNHLAKGASGGDLFEFATKDSTPISVVLRLRAAQAPANAGDVTVRPDDEVLILIAWDGLSGSRSARAISWPAEDRRRRLAPFLLHDRDAHELWKRIREPIADAPLGSGTRMHSGSLRSEDDVLDDQSQVEDNAEPNADEPRQESAEVDAEIGDDDPARPASASSVYFQRIQVGGLRGFATDERLQLAIPNGRAGSGLTIVVGSNNAGKSTVWEAFDAIARGQRQSVSFSEGRRNRAYGDLVNLELMRLDGSGYKLHSTAAGGSETEFKRVLSVSGAEPSDIVVVPSRRQFQAFFGRGYNPGRDWMSQVGEYVRNQSRDSFTGRLFALHQDAANRSIFNNLMTEVVGHPVDWTIDQSDQGQLFLKFRDPSGASHTSDGLGDGMTSLLFILDSLYDSSPESLVVIDEPELSLHPQFIRRLSMLIARYATDRQIVVFTHSPTFISWPGVDAGAEIARVYKSSGSSHIAQPSRPILEKVVRTALGNLFNPHVLGLDANEVFFLEDGVVLLEGQEDVIYLPRAVEQLGESMPGSVFGWGAGGAQNIGTVMELLQEMGFESVAAVLDNNVPDTVAELRDRFPSFKVLEIPAEDVRTKPSTPAKPEKHGLLAPGGTVRPELVDDLRARVLELRDYLARGS